MRDLDIELNSAKKMRRNMLEYQEKYSKYLGQQLRRKKTKVPPSTPNTPARRPPRRIQSQIRPNAAKSAPFNRRKAEHHRIRAEARYCPDFGLHADRKTVDVRPQSGRGYSETRKIRKIAGKKPGNLASKNLGAAQLPQNAEIRSRNSGPQSAPLAG